jgi:hypothetical protein
MAVLYPIINALCWYPDDGETEEELRDCAGGLIDLGRNLQSEVDGLPMPALEGYRDRSPLFTFIVPGPDDLNISGLGPPLERDGVSDGIWVILAPLPAGPHAIHFHAELPEVEFVVDVTYNLTVR